MTTRFIRRNYFALVLSVVLSFALVLTVVNAGSTISTNITTAGNLTVNSDSTFGDAATDVNLFTGTLQASTTALFSSGLTTYGAASVFNENSAAIDFRVESDGQANMLYVDGTNNKVGIASSTPFQELGVSGDIAAQSAATTTITLDSTTALTGGCLQMRGANGTLYRAYIVATSSSQGVTGSWQISAGVCQ